MGWQVFGKCLVCRDLEVASAYAKSHSFNCITLEGPLRVVGSVRSCGWRGPHARRRSCTGRGPAGAGDEVNRKGALTGGYRDQKTSRLEAIKRVKRAQANVQQLQEKLSKLQAQIDGARNRRGATVQGRVARRALTQDRAVVRAPTPRTQ